FHRRKIRGQDDFEDFAVVRVIEHHVLDAWWLDPRASRPHHDRPLAVELGLDPAFEHVDHLEIDVVVVALRHLFRPAGWNEADDMGPHHSIGRLGNAEVAVCRVAAQSALEILLAMMADEEALRRPRLVPHPRPAPRLAANRAFRRGPPRGSPTW